MQRYAIFLFAVLWCMPTYYGVPAALAQTTYLISPVVDYRTVRFNNENWHTLPHPKIAEFTVYEDGSAYGLTENGTPFYQRNVANDLGLRIQRFEIQDHYHYIVEGEIVYTLVELSVQLANAYRDRVTESA